MNNYQDYAVRYAAGTYWIVKCGQIGEEYVAPVATNECGAMLWNGIRDGMSEEQLVDKLVETYDIPRREALFDLNAFMTQLKDKI